MRNLGISLLAALILTSFPLFAAAQIDLTKEGDATISFAPEYPRPGDALTVKVRTYAADIQSADILWEVNGKAFKDGMGVDSIQVTAPAAGVEMTFRATVVANGRRFIAESSFTPAGVSLLWQGVGYTPPFYKGKTLVAYGGVTRVVALPDFRSSSGTRVPSDQLIFNWEKNGRKVLSVSGLGKSTVDFLQDSFLRGEDQFVVEVRDPSTNAVARNAVAVTPQKNIISLYEESPTLGRLYNKALSGTFTLKKAELSLITEPYFMSVPSREKTGVIYTWKQNGFSASSLQSARLTISNAQEGRSEISVSASSEKKLLQGGSAGLSVIFSTVEDTSTSNNPFSTNEN